MSKTKEATLESIKIRCPKSNKIVTIPATECTWTGYEDACDMCGSHMSVSVEVKCKCGKAHYINVYDG